MISVFDSLGDWAKRRPAVALSLLTILLFLSGTPVLPLMDRDEPRFATAAREMNADAELVVPTFNGSERLDKPILIYWAMQASYLFLGEHELAARLPSVICMVLLVVLMHHWAREWFGPKPGLVAGFATATTLQFLIHGRWAAADMPMILAIAAGHYALFNLLGLMDTDAQKKARDFGHQNWSWFWIFYLAMGLGFLAKGPLVWAAPLVTMMLYRFVFWRKEWDGGRLQLMLGIGVVLLVISPWGVPALIQTRLRFFTQGIGYHVVERGVDPIGGRLWIPGFYLATAFVSLMPWVAYVRAMHARVRLKWTQREAFLVSWAAGIYLIFSLFATQLPHYVLPAFPAVSLLLGSIFIGGDFESRSLAMGRRFFWGVQIVFLLLMFALMVVAPFPKYEGLFVNVGLGLGAAILLVGGLVAVSTALWFRGPYLQVGLGLMALVGSLWTIGFALRAANPAVQMQELLERQPENARLIAWRFTEGSLVFYAGRTWDLRLGKDQFGPFREELAKPGPILAVAVEEEMDLGKWLVHSIGTRFGKASEWPARRFEDEIAALPTTGFTRHTFEGFNPGRSRWVKLVVLERR